MIFVYYCGRQLCLTFASFLIYFENFLRKFVKYESFIITVLAFHNLQTTDMLLKSSDHFHIIIFFSISLYVFLIKYMRYFLDLQWWFNASKEKKIKDENIAWNSSQAIFPIIYL